MADEAITTQPRSKRKEIEQFVRDLDPLQVQGVLAGYEQTAVMGTLIYGVGYVVRMLHWLNPSLESTAQPRCVACHGHTL